MQVLDDQFSPSMLSAEDLCVVLGDPPVLVRQALEALRTKGVLLQWDSLWTRRAPETHVDLVRRLRATYAATANL